MIIDAFMFIFIISCGRIPGGSSYLAWRISTEGKTERNFILDIENLIGSYNIPSINT